MAEEKDKEKKEIKEMPAQVQKPAGAPQTTPQQQKPEMKKGGATGEKAEVVEVLGRTGTRGEIHQVMAKIITGRDKGRVLRRNIKGKVNVGDLLLLLETEREAKQIKGR